MHPWIWIVSSQELESRRPPGPVPPVASNCLDHRNKKFGRQWRPCGGVCLTLFLADGWRLRLRELFLN